MSGPYQRPTSAGDPYGVRGGRILPQPPVVGAIYQPNGHHKSPRPPPPPPPIINYPPPRPLHTQTGPPPAFGGYPPPPPPQAIGHSAFSQPFVGGFVGPGTARPQQQGGPQGGRPPSHSYSLPPSAGPPLAPLQTRPPPPPQQTSRPYASPSASQQLTIQPPPRSPSAPPATTLLPASKSQPAEMPGLTYQRPSAPPRAGGAGASASAHGHGRYVSAAEPSLRASPGPHARRSSDMQPGRRSWEAPPPPPSTADSTGSGGASASASGGAALPSLIYTLPDLKKLEVDRDKAMASGDKKHQIRWAADVLKFIERKGDGAKMIEAPLKTLVEVAIGQINQKAGGSDPVAEALYLRGDLQASGAFPTYLRKDLRSAFNDFELAARMGYAPAWFRIGRDYEVLKDVSRAKVAYEHGMNAGDVGSTYRLGMACLLGQLDTAVDYPRAVKLLRTAADKADIDTPQPAYIYGMLVAGEFSHVPVPVHLLQAESPGSTMDAEARKRIEKAAYFHFVPAQYKCGWSYEHARLDCPYDPLMSVQWYSLASQGGEIEADMALSKWFLCGADGCFEVDESLAFTFADKAARKGLPSAEFALGYYFEVGVGVEQDLAAAKKWYKRAAEHDNSDAKDRLTALDTPAPQTISRRDHLTHVDTKLQHTRTLAKNRSQKAGRKPATDDSSCSAAAAPSGAQAPSAQPNDLSRKKTMRLVQETAGDGAGPGRRRRNRTQGASEAPPPMPALSGGLWNASQPGPGPGPGPAPGSRISSQPGGFVGGFQGTPERASFAGPPGSGFVGGAGPIPRPSSAANSSGMSSFQSAPSNYAGGGGSPHNPGSRLPANGMPGPPPSASTGAGGNNTPTKRPSASGPDPVVYQTFAEMGFQSKKTQNDKDCVIC